MALTKCLAYTLHRLLMLVLRSYISHPLDILWVGDTVCDTVLLRNELGQLDAFQVKRWSLTLKYRHWSIGYNYTVQSDKFLNADNLRKMPSFPHSSVLKLFQPNSLHFNSNPIALRLSIVELRSGKLEKSYEVQSRLSESCTVCL